MKVFYELDANGMLEQDSFDIKLWLILIKCISYEFKKVWKPSEWDKNL